MKKKLLILMTFALAITMFIPFNKVDAGITDCDGDNCQTQSSTTLKKTETTTEEVAYDTNLDDYIAEKKADPQSSLAIGQENMEEWLSLFVAENEVYKYPVYIQTVFTGVTIDNNNILVGDPNELNNISSGTATYNYEIRYREVTVVKQANPYEIKEINLTVELPKVGDKITLDEGKHWDSQSPQAKITIPSGVKYELAGNAEQNYMYYIETLEQYKPFEGSFEKDKTYHMEIWMKPLQDYFFSENVKIYINGVELQRDEYEDDEIAVLYEFMPEPKQKEYKLTNNEETATATFTYEDGFDFELTFVDILTLTKEQREAMDISDEVYNQALELIKNSVKGYGSLIGIYAIEIEAPDRGYHDEVTIKVKLTDEMKKYNKFQFLYLDDENNFKVGEITDFTIEGDYLVGTLPHLSAYALVGSTVNNPKTGDNIMVFVILFGASIIGLTSVKLLKKKKQN